MNSGKARRIDPDTRSRYVDRIIEGEISQSAVAEELGVSRQAVSVWIKNRKAGIKTGRAGRPRKAPGIFTNVDRRLYRQIIRSYPPSYFDIEIDHDQWSPESIQHLVSKRSGIDLSIEKCEELMSPASAEKIPNQIETIETEPADTPEIPEPSESDTEIIREEDLGPYLEKIKEAQQRMKTARPSRTNAQRIKPRNTPPKNKRKAQRKARKKSRK